MKKRHYTRLIEAEREEISRGLAAGESLRAIARILDRNVSTIAREVRRANQTRLSYRAEKSQKHAAALSSLRKLGHRKLFENERLRRYVESRIKIKWSPEQIANKIKLEYPDDMEMRVSAETIYQYVYILPRGKLKEELVKGLRRERKRRRTKGPKAKVSRPLEDMLSIEERPPEVADRTIIGHWEGDLMIGRNRQSALGTLVERKTRFAMLVKLNGKSAEEIRKKFARKFRSLPQHARLSMTYDQGREMAQHKLLAKQAKIKVYFAHPASPWERPSNENFNGLVRQFFPKGTDFNKVSYYMIRKVQDLMNGRPRKVLNWLTPYEAFSELVALEA